jgi:hypothetical protein
MRCFLRPDNNKGKELHNYLKRKRFILQPLRCKGTYTINAYNVLYHNVKMWLYHTSIIRSGGFRIYTITLRSLSVEQTHTHVYVEMKYLPTVIKEGVYHNTMGLQIMLQLCVYYVHTIPVAGQGVIYIDIIRTVFHAITRLCQDGCDVNTIRHYIMTNYQLIISPNFLTLHIKYVKKLCKHLKWFDDHCSCNPFLIRPDCCTCKNVRLYFLTLYIESVLSDL